MPIFVCFLLSFCAFCPIELRTFMTRIPCRLGW